METVISKDGTALAFDRVGAGPALIMMGGALNDRQQAAELASLLAPHFTVFNFDRRGRSDSADTPPYSISKEIDDLNAVIGVAGGSAMLFANCTGGMLALEAVAQGAAVTKLVLYEPPYIVGDAHERLDEEFRTKITTLLDAGRNGDAVTHFLGRGIGLPAEVMERVQQMPMWPLLESLATTLPYDVAIAGDNSMPLERLPLVTAPTLVIDGGRSPQWQRDSVQTLVDALPHGTRHSIEGLTHTIVAEAVAPVVQEFLAAVHV